MSALLREVPAGAHERDAVVALPRPAGVAARPDDAPPRLVVENLTLAYGETVVARDLTLAIPEGRITVVVGPNACGKSTLLRAMGRLLAPRAGTVLLDGEAIARLSTGEVARRLGVLTQGPVAPGGLTVEELVGRGRYPHQKWWRQWSDADTAAVERAVALTGLDELRARPVDQLSGGQRQRAWIAMALAQETGILLLDEPTTYLDLCHRMDVLDLLAELNEREGKTIVIVLHDLNEAARYAHHLIALRGGEVVADGPPHAVLTADRVEAVFDLPCRVVADPITGTPMVVPLCRRGRRGEPVAGDEASWRR